MKQASSSFLKKRTKKLLIRFAPWGEVSGQGAKRSKKFLRALGGEPFFKKRCFLTCVG
jgi:hypothetical protein